MKNISANEAKARLSKLLEQVEKGEQFTITRHGVPIARLVPPGKAANMSVADAVNELKKLRKNYTLGGLSLRSMIEEGRRF